MLAVADRIKSVDQEFLTSSEVLRISSAKPIIDTWLSRKVLHTFPCSLSVV